MFRLFRCAPVAALLASFALPLPARADHLPDQGLWLPGITSALAEDVASSAQHNPAALGLLVGHELQLVHQQTAELSSTGVYYGGSVGPVAAGLSLEFLGGSGFPRETRAGFTAGFGTQALAFGATMRWHRSSSPAVDRSFTYDLGLTGRPWTFLSWAATARDLGQRGTPQYTLGLGFQFLDRRITLGVDRRFEPSSGPFSPDSRFDYALRVRVADGFTLVGGFTHNTRLDNTRLENSLQGHLGVVLDLGNTGVFGALGAPCPDCPASTPPQSTIGLRISSARHRGVATRSRTVMIELEKALAEAGPTLLPSAPREPFLELLGLLARIEDDPYADGIFVRTGGGAGLSLAEIEELRAAMIRLADKGKRVVFYLDGADDRTFYLASVADTLLVAPGAVLLINGFAATSTFVGEGLEDLGVHPEFVRVGAYKSAVDTLQSSSMSPEEREVTEALLDDTFTRYRAAVVRERGLTEAQFDELIGRGVLSPQEALDGGLIDGIVFPDEVPKKAGTEAVPLRITRGYASRTYTGGPWGARPQIAVIIVKGTIVQGETPSSPFGFGADVVGATTVIRAIEKAVSQSSVEAIVLRVDSPGGDAHASDLIWRAVKRADERKPVIASLGAVAASGGYYVACGARRIVANPSTITGSIGIFAGHADFTDLLERYGVYRETITRGNSADILGAGHRWTQRERAAMQRFVDAGYALFVKRVADGRSLTPEEVDAVGQGRVWTGAQARSRGLVDGLGGLREAVEIAKAEAGLEADDPVQLVFGGRARRSFLLPAGVSAAVKLPAPIEQLLRAVTPSLEVLVAGVPMALLPWHIEIR